jgi:hypothetical protein
MLDRMTASTTVISVLPDFPRGMLEGGVEYLCREYREPPLAYAARVWGRSLE